MATCSNCGTELQPGQGFLVPSADKKAPAVHLCAGCAEKAEATFEEESRAPRVPQALLLGLLAAVVGCVLWYAIVVITNYELGIVAIAIGWLVGTAVMFGAGRKRGLILQIMAVLITLVALLFSEYLIVRHFAVKHLTEQGYTDPTAIQLQAIPLALQGKDLLAGAQTGTGKTAGLVLPMLQRLSTSASKKITGTKAVRALILAPTRELAAQVEESVRTYGKYAKLNSTVIFGGVGINPQISALKRGVDIVVATPGRLLDHANERNIDRRSVRYLILDEADRMLDMGYIRDIRRVLAMLPPNRQNLLFSGTFSEDIRGLANGLLRNPLTIEVAPRNAPTELVDHRVHLVSQGEKRAVLSHLLKSGPNAQTLVFTRTKHGANRLAEQLTHDGLQCAAIHGNKSQSARTRALEDFKEYKVQVLVATDIAARGLDITELPPVSYTHLTLPTIHSV